MTGQGWHVDGLRRWVDNAEGRPCLATISLIGDQWMALVSLAGGRQAGGRQADLGRYSIALEAQSAVNEFLATHGVDCAGCDRCHQDTKIMTELTR